MISATKGGDAPVSGIEHVRPTTPGHRPPSRTRPVCPFEQNSLAVIRILLVDPRPLTAAAVQAFLEAAGGQPGRPRFEVTTIPLAGTVPAEQSFDLLLLHVSPAADLCGQVEKCLCALPAVHRRIPTVIFADNGSASDVAAAIRAGARGYLPSSLDSGKIVTALQLVAAGLAVLPSTALSQIGPTSGPNADAGGTEASGRALTLREREVLRRLQDGKPNKLIARELGVSQSTVKIHVRSVFHKLGVQNRTGAALAAGQVLLGRSDDIQDRRDL